MQLGHGPDAAAVSVALALSAGMVAQTLARHLKLPGIVLLLGAGVLLGPDLAGLVQPASLGPALPILVGFAVAVILFEGGMSLDLRRLRRQAAVIRRLLTVGALVTATGAALAARLIMGWDWRLSLLFGTLVIVTGPTVVTPLLRRIKVHHRVETVLEAEGVLIDAIGAVIAVVALEVAISLSGETLAAGLLDTVVRIGAGTVFGALGGLLIVALLRFERIAPDLENVFTLALVLALYELSHFFLPESGIVSVVVAGMVVGSFETKTQRQLMEFKEQLTVMLIGMLFVLLAASVRLAEVRALGWPGVATVAALMLVVRPLNVALSTVGSELSWRERGFIAWLAPRGIVAAAVASLFAQVLTDQGIAGGDQLRALVFMVIATTVLVQGLSGGLVAQLLGLRRATNRGYAVLGANEVGRALGRLLREAGEEVVFLDSNPHACRVVEQDGFKVVFGNVLEERTMARARLDERAAVIAVTTNQEANLLFAQQAIEEFRVGRAYVALGRGGAAMGESLLTKAGAVVLFGGPRDLELWSLRLRRELARIERWRLDPKPEETQSEGQGAAKAALQTPENLLLPLVVTRGSRTFPANAADGVRKGDRVRFAVFNEGREQAQDWLHERGWALEVEAARTPGESPKPAPGAAAPAPSR